MNPNFPNPDSLGGGGYIGNPTGIIGGIIGAGAGLIDSHLNRKVSRENTDKTIAANKAEAELAYQRSLEMWRLQNDYNSPQAQMARFQAAGLNPHLIYQQGNSGNAASPPNYQPANMQYKYESGNPGSALSAALPTLMSVGSWLQEMRKSEVQIQSTETNMQKVQQLIDFLEKRNPQVLEEAGIDLAYQEPVLSRKTELLNQSVARGAEQFLFDWGRDIVPYTATYRRDGRPANLDQSMKYLQMNQQQLTNAIKFSEAKLKAAQASWTDFGITSPQALMQMVLAGALGMAGLSLRSTSRKPATGKANTPTKARLDRTITNFEKNRTVKRNIYRFD